MFTAARKPITLTITVVAMLLAFGMLWIRHRRQQRAAAVRPIIPVQVVRGPMNQTLIEQGDIESSQNVYITCDVKSRGKRGTQILWVIADGSQVHQGDLVVQLDSSELDEQVMRQRIVVKNAEAALIRSETNKRTAEIALRQYLEGTYLSERRSLLSEIARAEQSLRKAELSLESVQRLTTKNMINPLQAKSAEFAVANARSELEDAQSRLRVLDELTREKFSVQLSSEIEASDAQYRSAAVVLREQQQKLSDLEDQVAKCSIHAPMDGFIIYNHILGRGRTEWIVEPGAYVRERQVILKMPDTSEMRVRTHLNETHMRLAREGAPVTVTVDAIPGLTMQGRVDTVKKWPKKDRLGTYVREFLTYVTLIDPPPEIQVGMTAEVEITVDRLDDVLQVPIESAVQHGQRLYCLRKSGQGRSDWETVAVQIGPHDTSSIAIVAGLEQGQWIAANPRDHIHLFQFPENSGAADRSWLQSISQREQGSRLHLEKRTRERTPSKRARREKHSQRDQPQTTN